MFIREKEFLNGRGDGVLVISLLKEALRRRSFDRYPPFLIKTAHVALPEVVYVPPAT